jgi:hypothetical protein
MNLKNNEMEESQWNCKSKNGTGRSENSKQIGDHFRLSGTA